MAENFIFQVDDPTIAMKVERATETPEGTIVIDINTERKVLFGKR